MFRGKDMANPDRDAKDLLADRDLCFISRTFPLWVAVGGDHRAERTPRACALCRGTPRPPHPRWRRRSRSASMAPRMWRVNSDVERTEPSRTTQ
jgi:hypothetical protein